MNGSKPLARPARPVRRAARLAAGVAVVVVSVLRGGVAVAQPSITDIVPARTPANTGATVTVFGPGIGHPADQVLFPGASPTTPLAWGIGWVNVRVPATYSGDVQVRSGASGLLSGAYPNFIVSFCWRGQQWSAASFPIAWRLHASGAPGCTVDETRGAVELAHAAWTCNSGASSTYAGTTTASPNLMVDGLNVHGWTTTGWSPSLVAATSIRYLTGTGEIVEFGTAYNAQHYQWSCGGSGLPGKYDVQDVAAHEQGYALGLGNLYGNFDADESMYAPTDPQTIFRRTLDLDDMEGAEFLYPRAGRGNLVPTTPAGWSAPLAPRNTSDPAGSPKPLPAALTGNATSYLNLAVANTGSDCVSPHVNNSIRLDGQPFYAAFMDGVWGAGIVNGWLNLGAAIRGGRHTLEVLVDAGAEAVESSELDNFHSSQYVWSPLPLSDQSPLVRLAAPDPGAGVMPNCDGFQLTGTWWGAVGILAVGGAEDHDIALYDDYAGSVAGFESPLKSSAWSGPLTDFVVVNGNDPAVGFGATRFVGVTRQTGSSAGSFAIQQSNVVGATLEPTSAYGAEVASGVVTMAANGVLKLHEVHLADPATTYRFTLDNLTGLADLHMALFPATGAYFSRFDYAAASMTSGTADESFTYQPPAAGYYAVVVWKRGIESHGFSNTYELRVGRALANLDPADAFTGWSSSLVPRSMADATVANVPLPPALPGNADTWMNWSIRQEGPGTMPAWSGQLWLDFETSLDTRVVGGGNVPGYYVSLNRGPTVVRGGRHTLTTVADPTMAAAESNEADNLHSEQFVFGPLPVFAASPVVRPVPPVMGTFVQPNGDGARFSPTAGFAWVAAVATLKPGDDYDVALYDDYTGSLSGFENLRAVSFLAGNALDFVVGAYVGTPPTVYPAALRFVAATGGDCILDQADSFGRVGGEAASYLDQTLAPRRMVDVYEAELRAGNPYRFRLTLMAGTADLQVAVFPSSGFAAAAEAFAVGGEVLPGLDLAVFTPPTDGWYPIVVLRPDGRQAEGDVTYSLEWGPAAPTDAPAAGLPAALTFAGAFPNPSHGRATLEFALPAASHVRLALYDARGRQVARLADRDFPAGRHRLEWNGRDESGAAISSGVYWAKLEAGGQALSRRIHLLR